MILAGLLVLAAAGAACGPPAAGQLAHPKRPDLLVNVPPAITDGTYELYRDQFDAVAIDAPKRGELRARLLGYLLDRLDKELSRGQETEAFKTFKDALTLFDPVEVHQGKVRAPQLARVAARLVDRFSPRGDEKRVVLPLCVRMTLEPEDRAASAKFQQISRWMRETGELVGGRSREWQRTIGVLEEVVRVWPSRLAVEQLRKAYIEQRVAIARAFHIGPYSHLRGAVSALFQTGFKVARMYLLVDRMDAALQRLEEVATERSPDEELQQLLERAHAKTAGPQAHLQLASFFDERAARTKKEARQNQAVALRVCRNAQARFPESAPVHWCVGRLAAELGRATLSVINLEQAVKIAPDNRTYVEKLAEQYQERLFSLIGDEKLDQATAEMERIESFYKRAATHFKRPIDPPLSRVYFAIGHGLYNAGRIDHATELFEKSIKLKPSPEALLQLATIRVKRRRARDALKLLDRAEKLAMPSAHARAYLEGRIEGLRGQALHIAGKRDQALRAHQRAVAAWQSLQALGLDSERKAEAYVHEARSLFAMDERARGMDALDRAIDVLPDRKETYADVIALLVTYGHMPEALDAYHRALGRRVVSEYLKSYCSFWIIGLARRAKLPPDPLAMNHLANLRGDAWYTELAQLIRGKTTYEALLAKAKGPSNLAELHYYQADLLLAAGDRARARELWRKVLATDMMAFYEFDMAAFNLQNGPSAVSTRPIDRQRPKAERISRDTISSKEP